MKKTFLAIITLIVVGSTNAQIKDKGTVEITPKIGSSTYFESNENYDTDYNAGIEIGATVDYYFNDRWSLRSGLITNKMGGIYRDFSTRVENKLYYLNIPINANWHFGSTRKWNLNFGLTTSFLTKGLYIENGQTYQLHNNDIQSAQLGFTYGIGYKIEINKKFGILLDAQFFDGLTNINKSAENRITNHGFSFNLGGVIQL
ncbi:porin family protein [Flavobacterium faecale]|uniref:porin family protein n=1 Tax=Flavobacterium faecale TaxID=1355330 RepID=UPI003AAD1213